MQFLTDFADQAVMLPVFATVAIGLAISGWYRGLAAWLFAVGGALALTGLLKYVFYTCGSVLGATGVHSPSGHTAAASAIYGGGLLLLLRGRVPALWLAPLPLLVAVFIGLSRVEVGAHVPAETVVGAAVGLAGAALLLLLAGRRPPLRVWPMLAGCLVAIVVFHGARLTAESALHHFVLFTWLPLPAVCRV